MRRRRPWRGYEFDPACDKSATCFNFPSRTFPMDRLASMEDVKAVETGSFAAAAEALDSASQMIGIDFATKHCGRASVQKWHSLPRTAPASPGR